MKRARSSPARLGSLVLLLWLGALPLAAQPPREAELLAGGPVVARVWTTDAELAARLGTAVDVWTYRPREGYLIALLSPDQLRVLREAGLPAVVDVERTESLRLPFERLPGQVEGIPGFPCYRTVEETYSDLAQVATDHPDLAAWVDIGDSWEKLFSGAPGYDLRALVLGNQNLPGPKAPFVLIAAMHARELATAELATRFAETLVSGYGSDPDATWILDHTEIHVIPQLNPDGRKRAESGLSWRKNADNNHCANSNSRGVDLNRNSTFFWGGPFSSGSACSLSFRGPSAASEPETSAVEFYIGQVFPDQRGDDLEDPAPASATGLFISLHSFGEFVLWPWEGLSTPAPNGTQLSTLGRKFGFHNGYLACQTGLPPASGTTVDQAYGGYGVAGYTFEVGNSFFESCTSFETDILPKNMPALVYAAKAARRPYQDPRGPEILTPAVSASPVAQGEPVTLTAVADDSRYASNGCGTEPVQEVAAVQYTVDVAPWQAPMAEPMSPADGAFDSPVEGATAVIDTSALDPGRHLVYVFSFDTTGARGVPSAVFLDVGPEGLLFADGFESGDVSRWSLAVGE